MTVEELKNYFNICIDKGEPPHAIIVDGIIGDEDKKPVYEFVHKLMGSLDHPDIIKVSREKAHMYSIDEIRSQVVDNIPIKPYASKYKIYIIEDAELVRKEGQNALLKSLEEPPAYAVIILLTKSAGMLLETIRSRCVILSLGTGTYEITIDDETVSEIVKLAMHLPKTDAKGATTFSKSIDAIVKNEQATYEEIFDIIQMLFRDALRLSLGSEENLLLKDEKEAAKFLAENGNVKLALCIEQIFETRKQIAGNVNKDLAIRQMVLSMNK